LNNFVAGRDSPQQIAWGKEEAEGETCTPPNGGLWRDLHLARAVFPECAMFVAMLGDYFRLHRWVKPIKG